MCYLYTAIFCFKALSVICFDRVFLHEKQVSEELREYNFRRYFWDFDYCPQKSLMACKMLQNSRTLLEWSLQSCRKFGPLAESRSVCLALFWHNLEIIFWAVFIRSQPSSHIIILLQSNWHSSLIFPSSFYKIQLTYFFLMHMQYILSIRRQLGQKRSNSEYLIFVN